MSNNTMSDYFNTIHEKINQINCTYSESANHSNQMKKDINEIPPPHTEWANIEVSSLKSILYPSQKSTSSGRQTKKPKIIIYDDSIQNIQETAVKISNQKPWTKLTPDNKAEKITQFCVKNNLPTSNYIEMLKKRKITKNHIEYNEETGEINAINLK